MSKKLKLGDVCQIGDGNHSSNYPKASEMVDAGIPFLRAGNIQDGNVVDKNMKFISPEKHEILKKGHLRKGDLLITNRGEIGKLAIVSKEFHGANLNSQIAWLRPDERLLSSYLYYYLKSPAVSSSLYAQQTGTALQQLTIRKIRSIEIFTPPITEQQRIVTKLESAFAEIDKAINCFNKQLIEINNFRYKKIQNLMIDLGKEYGLASLNDISIIQPKKKIVLERLNTNHEVSFLNMNSLGIEKKYSESFTYKKLKEVYNSYQYFENNDVIFAKITPCFENGKLSIVRNLKNKTGFGSSEFVILRPKGLIDSEFLYYALLDKNFREEGKKQMSGAVGHKRVTKDYFYNYKIPTPPFEIQTKVVNLLDKMWDNSKSFYLAKFKKTKELENLKSSILYQEIQYSSK